MRDTEPFLMTVTSEGSMPVIESRILLVLKSCQKLKTALRTRTMSRTTARARLDGAAGFPSGFLCEHEESW